MVNPLKEYVSNLNSAEKAHLEKHQSIELTIDGQKLLLSMEHLIKHSTVDERFALKEEGDCRVLLDLIVTEDLQKEGQMRELIRAIQDARKQWNLALHQYIKISIVSDDVTIKWLKEYEAFLRKNVLLDDVQYQIEYEKNKQISLELFDKKVVVYLID